MADSLYVAPLAVVKKPTVKPERIAIAHEGEDVLFTIGNSTIRFHYEDALKISQWLRMRAKQAKRTCGDVSRHWSALAVLDGIK